jgi:mRNA degradation ribonuclease J1/J2
MLNFIGKGSCFNTNEINNSAYYKEENYLFLIDCGESVFKEIVNDHLLDGVNHVDILITHFHSDHIGSLPSLIFYLSIIIKPRPTVIYPMKDIITFLSLSGVSMDEVNIVEPKEFDKFKIEEIKQQHSKNLNAYGYLIHLKDKVIYYSGDSKTIKDDILNMFINDKIDYFYQDVSEYKTDVHMYIDDLVALIPTDKRNKLTCMHFDSDDTRKLAAKYGFKV